MFVNQANESYSATWREYIAHSYPLENPVSIYTWECIPRHYEYCTVKWQCFNAHNGERDDPHIRHPSSTLTTSNTTSFYLEFNACPYLCPIQQTNWFSKVRLTQNSLFHHRLFPSSSFYVGTCSGLAAGRGWGWGGGVREVAGVFLEAAKEIFYTTKMIFLRKANWAKGRKTR